MRGTFLSKEYNTKRILKVIRERGPLSRVELSELMNIPQPTMTRIIEGMLNEDIVREAGYGQSTGGRKPVLLAFNETCYYAIGVDLGRSSVKIALTDLNGNFLSFRKKETQYTTPFSSILEFIKEAIEDMLAETRIDTSRILGVGVGVPGPLNENSRGVISPPMFYGEKEIALGEMLQEMLELPVIIDNDANVGALAEKWHGKGIGCTNFVYVMADVGIGAGIVINGDLYRGAYNESGELGHTVIHLYGEKCNCGKYGCLETLVSIPKLVEQIQQKLKIATVQERAYFQSEVDQITIRDAEEALGRGSQVAHQVMEEAGRLLGVGLSNVVNLFGPEMIILGGRLGLSHPIIKNAVQSTIENYAFGLHGKKIPITVSEHREAVVVGAAALVIDQTFSLFSVLKDVEGN